jgi:hypothetical protein
MLFIGHHFKCKTLGEAIITVTVDVDANGAILLKATSGGKEKIRTIKNDKGRLSQEDIVQRFVAEAEELDCFDHNQFDDYNSPQHHDFEQSSQRLPLPPYDTFAWSDIPVKSTGEDKPVINVRTGYEPSRGSLSSPASNDSLEGYSPSVLDLLAIDSPHCDHNQVVLTEPSPSPINSELSHAPTIRFEGRKIDRVRRAEKGDELEESIVKELSCETNGVRCNSITESNFVIPDILMSENVKAMSVAPAETRKKRKSPQSSPQDLLLLDVTPLTLTIEDSSHMSIPIVNRNTTIPTRKTLHCVTANDYQTRVKVALYEGERTRVKDNCYLGEVVFSDIPSCIRGNF